MRKPNAIYFGAILFVVSPRGHWALHIFAPSPPNRWRDWFSVSLQLNASGLGERVGERGSSKRCGFPLSLTLSPKNSDCVCPVCMTNPSEFSGERGLISV